MAAGPETVLLVEDDALIRMHGAELLEDAGYRVVEAANADVALAVIMADPHAVDVLLTDVHMPGSMDGIGLAREVDRRFPWIRLVITSANARMSDDDVPDHGRFVAKPWELPRVVGAIQGTGRERR